MSKDSQLELLLKIQAIGINIVTCGNCGTIILVKCNEEEHYCFDCEESGEPSNFPDLFYEGWKGENK